VNIDAFVEKALEISNKQAGPETAKNLIESNLKEFQAQAKMHLNELIKTGCKNIFVVFSMYDFPYFFVAFQSGNDQAGLSQNILNVMKDFNVGKLELYSTDGLIIVGLEQAIARLKTISPVQSEMLAKGFQVCGDTTVQAVLFPTFDQRKILAETLPQIPFGSGTIDPATVARDLQWAALGLNGPPSTFLNVTIQSQNSESADDLLAFVKNFYSLIEKNPTAKEIFPQLDQLLKSLMPEKHDNQLVLKIEPKAANSIIDNIIAPSLHKAREEATRVVCGSNLKGIGAALFIYANDYNDHFPPDLATLIPKAEMSPKGFICPSTMQKDSYIYRGATLSTSDIPGLILAYDKKGNHSDGRNVVFLDSHVEWVKEERFQELINEDNKYRKEKGYIEIPAEK
jgi:prepilin-type processing-associated H-X9-DG protein